ncbi:uncharacterized protein LOC135836981 [Planococcus citri]|uniref:uncharacterized protein LOC135836981 n=1 Tax=Planococcus citri TaxID=170843 RepID=UPI0031F83F51
MAKYWAFSRILAGLAILVVFASSAPAAPSSSASETLVKNFEDARKIVRDYKTTLESRMTPKPQRKVPGISASSASNSDSNTTDLLRSKFSKFQNQFITLSKSGSLDKAAINVLNNTFNEFNKLVDEKSEEDLKKAVKEQELKERISELEKILQTIRPLLESILRNDIVRNVQSRRFSDAEQQLQYFDDYKYLGSQVYNGSINNFDLLQNFGSSVKDYQHRFNVYNALYNEMKSNGHKDISKLLQLSESLQKGISSLSNVNNTVETQTLISTLWNENQDAAIEPISNAFLNDSSWEMVKQLTNVINGSSVKYVDNVYTKVIEKVFEKMDTVEILRKAKANLKCLDECVSIHRAVFDQLQSNGDLFGNSTISLTRYIKATMDDADYKNTHPDMQTRHKQIKDKLPKSVRNAVFSSLVCVKNTKYNEFFYASGLSNETNSEGLHNVSTLINGDGGSPANFKWKVSFLGSSTNFNLTNEALNEYLYSSDNFEGYRRKVFTKKLSSDTATGVNGSWRFEVNGDGVFIINVDRNEYLFADEKRKAMSQREVFTSINVTSGAVPADSRWDIVDCTDSEQAPFKA